MNEGRKFIKPKMVAQPFRKKCLYKTLLANSQIPVISVGRGTSWPWFCFYGCILHPNFTWNACYLFPELLYI